jgi:hypothetical protein
MTHAHEREPFRREPLDCPYPSEGNEACPGCTGVDDDGACAMLTAALIVDAIAGDLGLPSPTHSPHSPHAIPVSSDATSSPAPSSPAPTTSDADEFACHVYAMIAALYAAAGAPIDYQFQAVPRDRSGLCLWPADEQLYTARTGEREAVDLWFDGGRLRAIHAPFNRSWVYDRDPYYTCPTRTAHAHR